MSVAGLLRNGNAVKKMQAFCSGSLLTEAEHWLKNEAIS